MEAAAPVAEEGVPPATIRAQLEALGDSELKARVLELGVTPAQMRKALIDLAIQTVEARAAADPRVVASAAEWSSLRGDPTTKESLIHITFSKLQFKDGAFERSIKAGEALKRFGCFSFYNPNTDCPDTRTQAQKAAGAQKGASNWLEEFRTSLKRSRETCGFVWQLQPNADRERSSMQVAEQEMAMEVERRGVPVVSTYAEATEQYITNALEIALRQWEAGQFVEEALPSEGHAENIDDAALRRLGNVERHPALRRLTKLDLRNTPITDAAPLAALVGLTELVLNNTEITDAAPLAALVGLTTLGLTNTEITDAAPLAALVGLKELSLYGTAIADAAPLAALVGLTELYLNGTPITDAAPLAALVGLTTLVLRGTPIAESDATVAALRERGVRVKI
eukprot:COSAG01_NODE_10511_length_2148_cov_14.260615_1_plen_397_part_00